MIDNVTLDQSAPSRFARLLLSAQCLECIEDGKQAVGVLPDRIVHCVLSLGYLEANFLVPQRHKNTTVCGEPWAGAPSCCKVKLLSDDF